MRKASFSSSFATLIIILVVFVSGIVIINACRKIDRQVTEATPDGLETKFFNSHQSSKSLVQAVTRFVKGENSKYHFVERLIKQIGFPYWDKSLVYSNIKAAYSRNSGIGDSANVVFIPFVRDTQNVVNAALRITMTPNDTTFKIFCDWQYTDSANTGLNGRYQSLLLMALDKSVFGHNFFGITDSLAFDGLGQTVRAVKLDSTTNIGHRPSIAGRTSLLEVVYTITVCYTSWVDLYQGQVHGCYPGQPDCNEYQEENTCESLSWTEYEYDDGGEGGTGDGDGNSGGSGGGSGGGWTVPLCPGLATRGSNYEVCTPGWEPVTYPTQPDPCSKTQPLRTNNDYISNFLDLKTKTGLNYETGYIETETGFDLVSGLPNEGEVNFTVSGMIKSYMHTHVGNGLPIFSVGDLQAIYVLLATSHIIPSTFTYGVTTPSGNSYILVIDNVAEFLAFGTKYFEPDGISDRGELERLYMYGYKVDKASTSQEAETRFLDFLKGINAGASVLKANNDFTAYSKLILSRNKQATPVPCP